MRRKHRVLHFRFFVSFPNFTKSSNPSFCKYSKRLIKARRRHRKKWSSPKFAKSFNPKQKHSKSQSTSIPTFENPTSDKIQKSQHLQKALSPPTPRTRNPERQTPTDTPPNRPNHPKQKVPSASIQMSQRPRREGGVLRIAILTHPRPPLRVSK